MEKHFNGLTPAEAERLALLLEELGETAQVIGKILRHGYESSNPFDEKRTTNRRLLSNELGDVLAAMMLMKFSGDINQKDLDEAKERKVVKADKYLHHNSFKAHYVL
jgi:NTP pyrophosphatase (non-canonical NTP hydrolase)